MLRPRRLAFRIAATVLAALAVTTVATTDAQASGSPTPRVTKLLVFMLENHSLAQMEARMPFTFRLAREYAWASRYHAIGHPSLRNYLAITGGSTFGVFDDALPAVHRIHGRSVFGQALANGRTARVYVEGMPRLCGRHNGGHSYLVRHNPWTYFVDERGACRRDDVRLARLRKNVSSGNLPNAGMVVPNLVHDAHAPAGGSLARADRWLRRQVTMVQGGPDWRSGRLAIVVTADENDGHRGDRVLTVVASPSVARGQVRTRLNHYSLTGLYDDVLGVRLLRQARTAPSMARAFGVPVSGS